jgi:hypothetical protein
MRFLKDDGTPYIFGTYNSSVDKRDAVSGKLISDPNKDGLDWWEWSTQPEHKDAWIAGMKKQGGEHWCACALCVSEAVDRFGCDKLDIQCNATDIAFLRKRVEKDGKKVLKSNLECLYKKCGKDAQKDWPVIGDDCTHRGCARLYEEDHSLAVRRGSQTGFILSFAVVIGVSMGLVAGVTLYRRGSASSARERTQALPEAAFLQTEPME